MTDIAIAQTQTCPFRVGQVSRQLVLSSHEPSMTKGVNFTESTESTRQAAQRHVTLKLNHGLYSARTSLE